MSLRDLPAGMTVAGQSLRARPLRSLLVVITLLLGVLGVVCVSAASTVTAHAVTARADIQSGRTPTYTADLEPRQIDPALAAIQDGGMNAVAVMTEIPVRIGESPGPVSSLRLVSVAGDLRSIRPFPVRSGRWLTGDYSSGYAMHLVLNERAAELFQGAQNAPVLRAGAAPSKTPVTISGVINDATDEPAAYVRWDEAASWLPETRAPGKAQLLLHGDTRSTAVIMRRIEATTQQPLKTERADQGQALSASVNSIQWIFTVISGVALVVGAVAILNIGLATVAERVDELALRRAVGATRGYIILVVLLEAVLLGFLAAAAALACAVPLLDPVARFLYPDLPTDQAITFPVAAAIAASAASMAAAIIGGVVPALRAGHIPIAHVMRA